MAWLRQRRLNKFLSIEVIDDLVLLLVGHKATVYELMVLLILVQCRLMHSLCDVVDDRLLLCLWYYVLLVLRISNKFF